MELEFRNTFYFPKFEVTDNVDGLGDNDFWINIHFILKNDEIEYEGDIPGMSFQELKYWNNKNKEYIDGLMTNNEVVSFIRRIGELDYYPKENKIEKKLYIYDDLDKYYSIYFTNEEIKKIYEMNKQFIDEVEKG